MSAILAPESSKSHQPNAHNAKLVRVDYVIARLDKPRSTIYALVRNERIPGVVRVGKCIRFNQDKLEAWIDAGGGAA